MIKRNMLIQKSNKNHCMSSGEYATSPEELRNLYGDRIEGEYISVYDFNKGITYKWTYKDGRYIEI